MLLGNVHTTPFHIFKRTYDDPLLADHVKGMSKTFLSHHADNALIAGDFNFGDIEGLFTEVIGEGKPYRDAVKGIKTNIWDDVQKEHVLVGQNTEIE